MSKLADGRFLVTYQEGSEPDLSGLRVQLQQPGRVDEGLTTHRRWLVETQIGTVPFEPTKILNDLLQHDIARAHKLISMGLARWRFVDQTVWSYTIVGSVKVAIQGMKDVRTNLRMRQEL